MMKSADWKRRSRFVLFLDILGFKELVAKESHSQVISKLEAITEAIDILEGEKAFSFFKEKMEDIAIDQTKSITFSDSIIVFSKGSSYMDATKIISAAHMIQGWALDNKIPIKGAISYGEITVDFDNSIFFGQPLIDAFHLHEDLFMLGTVIHHDAEKRFIRLKKRIINYEILYHYDVMMKYGKVNHLIIRPSKTSIQVWMTQLKKLYLTVSGKPRMYIDNTIAFYKELIDGGASKDKK